MSKKVKSEKSNTMLLGIGALQGIPELAVKTITVGTRGKGNTLALPLTNAVAKLVHAAISAGYNMKPQHSCYATASIINSATGKLVATVFSNSAKGTGARVFLNALGTKTEVIKTHYQGLANVMGISIEHLQTLIYDWGRGIDITVPHDLHNRFLPLLEYLQGAQGGQVRAKQPAVQ